MWAMSQAFTGDLQSEIPQLAWVPYSENGRQGRVLQQFYSTSGPSKKMLFRGCDIPKEPSWPSLPPVDREQTAATFLGIPIAIRLMPSFGICNNGS